MPAASLDWSQLSILGSLNWVSQSTTTNSTVSNSFGETGAISDQKPGWLSSSSAVTISNAGAQSTSALLQSLSASSYSSLADIGWSNSSGSSILTGSFTATADGWIIFTVPYSFLWILWLQETHRQSASREDQSIGLSCKSGGSISTDSMELFSTVYNGNTC